MKGFLIVIALAVALLGCGWILGRVEVYSEHTLKVSFNGSRTPAVPAAPTASTDCEVRCTENEEFAKEAKAFFQKAEEFFKDTARRDPTPSVRHRPHRHAQPRSEPYIRMERVAPDA
jgi:hypothetical protein